MKFTKKVDGMVKIAGDYCYPVEVLKKDFRKIRKECHKHGLKFYCAENRLRFMGDDMCCCGIDGLEGFEGNKFNLCHFYNGDVQKPTETMQKKGTAIAFHSLHQTGSNYKEIKHCSFAEQMIKEYQTGSFSKVFDKDGG